MKVVILAGGLGSRLAEETEVKPKPMVEIGDRPILWHILRHYSHYGFNEFYIALGYKGEYVKRYFLDYCALRGSMTVRMGQGKVERHDHEIEDWDLHLIDTGLTTMTGGRVKRLRPFLGDEPFMLTYGDGVSNVNLDDLLAFHQAAGKIVTLTAVHPPARFGLLEFTGDLVTEFQEKPRTREGWINGGFMVVEPGIFDYLPDDATILETHALQPLARAGQVAGFQHDDFWQCMDTLRDKHRLNELWESGNAPWRH